MTSSLTRLLDFDDQFRRDSQQSQAFLHRRDRRFAQQQQEQKRPLTVPAWLAELHALNDQRQSKGPDPRLRRWRQARWIFAVLGAVLGAVFMAGLLVYDGSRQINVTLLLVLMGLQLALALLTSLQAGLGWQPWGGLLGRTGEEGDPLQALRPALSARIAHTGGLMFAISGLLTLLIMVLVQDLAFGWSTTLQASADSYYRLVSLVALPWQALWPDAVPSAELVAASQYYRLNETPVSDPALLGTWWPFVLMAWLTYVLFPRLLLLLLAALQVRGRAGSALRNHPGYQPLFYRFDTPWVETRGEEEVAREPAPAQVNVSPLPASGTLIHWAGAGQTSDELIQRLSHDAAPLQLRAGGNSSLQDDAATLQQAGERRQPVMLVARGWEPPTGELSDFLFDAREQWPAGTLIALVPLADEQGGELADETLLAQWQRFIERQKDANLLLCAATHP
ncbi:DUF2868 domain-containing protein [Alcanivorax sp. S6407]|uniref:DUF2868 domain-containing protein n=1 Tax=Alcanivorax sp. S6407 TaxID=2926424 RepID=UPI001FF56294|nr:DUF2868 domain-containing protein [Alcanivorax sp. S6407]MCK0154398.1 DUF2868 domain-containing protein [Alcanivorax sp. S6407]